MNGNALNLNTPQTRIFRNYLEFARVLLEPSDADVAAGKTASSVLTSDGVAIVAAILALVVEVHEIDKSINVLLPEAGRGA